MRLKDEPEKVHYEDTLTCQPSFETTCSCKAPTSLPVTMNIVPATSLSAYLPRCMIDAKSYQCMGKVGRVIFIFRHTLRYPPLSYSNCTNNTQPAHRDLATPCSWNMTDAGKRAARFVAWLENSRMYLRTPYIHTLYYSVIFATPISISCSRIRSMLL